jgi:hypothetical protein
VVFVLTEFQLVDRKTAEENDRGENSHENYKARQHRSVRQRLVRIQEQATEKAKRAKAASRARAAERPRPRTRAR